MRFLLMILPAALLAACGTRTAEELPASQVGYDYVTVQKTSDPGCDSARAQCAVYRVKYPKFYNLSFATEDSLVRAIDRVLAIGHLETKGQSAEGAGEKFVADFNRFMKAFPETTAGWFFYGDVEVNTVSDTLLALTANTQYYTGGAHGGYGKYFINLDPATGRPFTLGRIVNEAELARLTLAAERIFRAKYDVPEGQSLADAGFTFPDDRFALNDNFGLGEAGITFTYNVYEIAPYVMGQQEITIPFASIR